MEGSTAGEERVFKKRMAQQIDAARLQAEGAKKPCKIPKRRSLRLPLSRISRGIYDRAQEGQPQVLQPTDFTPQQTKFHLQRQLEIPQR